MADKGFTDRVKGKAKEVIGDITDNAQMEREGIEERLEGEIKKEKAENREEREEREEEIRDHYDDREREIREHRENLDDNVRDARDELEINHDEAENMAHDLRDRRRQ